MRRAVLLVAAAVLLGGPTLLAFFAGGFFDGPRFVATLLAWLIVLVVALTAPRPLPRSAPGLVALAGLALITAWTGASLAWAPLSEPATDNLVRLLLYLGVFIAAIAVLRDRAPSARSGARAGARRCSRNRIRAGGATPPRPHRADRIGPSVRPARAADHVLERRGRPGRDGARALRAAGRDGDAAAGAAGRRGRRVRTARDGRLPDVFARGDRGGSGGADRAAGCRAHAATVARGGGGGHRPRSSLRSPARRSQAWPRAPATWAVTKPRERWCSPSSSRSQSLLGGLSSEPVGPRLGEALPAPELAIAVTCPLPPPWRSGFALPDSWPRVWSKRARRASCRGRLGYRDSRRPTPGATTTGGSVSRRSPTTRSGVWVAAAFEPSGCASGLFGRPLAKSTRSRSRWPPSLVSLGCSASACSWAASPLRVGARFGAAPRSRRGGGSTLRLGAPCRDRWDWQVPAVTLPAIVLAAALISASESPEPVPYREPSGLRRRISAAA